MNIRSGRFGARWRRCTQSAIVVLRRVLGQVARRRGPRCRAASVAPPSSVSHTPAAEIATASRSGSPGHGAIECRHSPPPPGCQSGRVGCSQSAAVELPASRRRRGSRTARRGRRRRTACRRPRRRRSPRSARAPRRRPRAARRPPPAPTRPPGRRRTRASARRTARSPTRARGRVRGSRIAYSTGSPANARAVTSNGAARLALEREQALLRPDQQLGHRRILPRSRAGRRRGRRRRPRVSSLARSPLTNTLMWRRITAALVEDPAVAAPGARARARAAARRPCAPSTRAPRVAGELLERSAQADECHGVHSPQLDSAGAGTHRSRLRLEHRLEVVAQGAQTVARRASGSPSPCIPRWISSGIISVPTPIDSITCSIRSPISARSLVVAPPPWRVMFSERLDLGEDVAHRGLGVAEEHRGLRVVEERVVDAGEAASSSSA